MGRRGGGGGKCCRVGGRDSEKAEARGVGGRLDQKRVSGGRGKESREMLGVAEMGKG